MFILIYIVHGFIYFVSRPEYRFDDLSSSETLNLISNLEIYLGNNAVSKTNNIIQLQISVLQLHRIWNIDNNIIQRDW